MACVESDIKRVLAYSTVSQLGYMMAAAGAGAPEAGLPAPARPRRLQGPALPRRRRRDPRGPHQRHVPHGGLRGMPWTGCPSWWARWRWPACGRCRASSRRRRSWPGSGRGACWCPSCCCRSTVFLTAFYMFRVVFLAFFGTAHPHGHATPRARADGWRVLGRWGRSTLALGGNRRSWQRHHESRPGWLPGFVARSWPAAASCWRGRSTSGGRSIRRRLARALGPDRLDGPPALRARRALRRPLPRRAARLRAADRLDRPLPGRRRSSTC